MKGDEALNIKVKIAGREFALEAPQKKEVKIRAAAQLISETFEKYKDKFPTNDYANTIAMTALTLLVDNHKQADSEETLELKDALYELEDQLEEFISEEL